MLINAYKLNLNINRPNEIKKISSSEIINEVSDKIIKEYNQLIEQDLKQSLSEKIKEELYNNYCLSDEKVVLELEKEVVNKIYGYGILQKFIDDEEISDIRVVKFDNIYIKKKGVWIKLDEGFESKEKLEEFVRFCALKNNSTINFENPVAVFSDRKNGLRIEAGIDPVNVESPNIVIRIHRKNSACNLENLYVVHNMMDKTSYQTIKKDIGIMQNIILCGKGGSGKTTLLKALIDRIPKELAITTNEETAELYLDNRNVIQRECILNRSDEKNVDLERLSKHALVMSNDIIVIGELKGKEANNFFDSISTGHVGLATIHADSAINTVDRLITLIKKDIKSQYYSEEFLRRFLCSSIDYIIFMKDFKVNEIMKIVYKEQNKTILYKKIYSLKENVW